MVDSMMYLFLDMKYNAWISSDLAALGMKGTPAAEIGTIAFNFLYILVGVFYFMLLKFRYSKMLGLK